MPWNIAATHACKLSAPRKANRTARTETRLCLPQRLWPHAQAHVSSPEKENPAPAGEAAPAAAAAAAEGTGFLERARQSTLDHGTSRV